MWQKRGPLPLSVTADFERDIADLSWNLLRFVIVGEKTSKQHRGVRVVVDNEVNWCVQPVVP